MFNVTLSRQDPLALLQTVTARVASPLLPLVVYGRSLVADERGDEGTTSSIVRVMMVVIGGVLVIGIIWTALRGAGVKIAGDIGGLGGWSP